MKWNITSSVIKGSGHKSPQDSISKYLDNDFACLVLSDGAGVARRASEGALFTTTNVVEILKQHKEGIFNYTTEEIRNIILNNLLDRLKQKAENEHHNIDDYMCTLIFFISNGEKYIYGNLGDGLIGCMDIYGEGKPLSLPEHGKFVNQSYFITHKNAQEHFRIGMGPYKDNMIYFLMTDGTAECLYNFKHETFSKALTTYCNWTVKYNPYDVNNYLKISMIRLFPQKTNDDCALAMIYLRER